MRVRAHLTLADTPRPTMPIQSPITAAYYRGGTSRAVFFQPQHLPRDRAQWPALFRQVIGSGDPYGRQLDGMGAGVSSLSKVCLVEPHGRRVVVPRQVISDRLQAHSVDRVRSLLETINARGESRDDVDVDYTFVGLGIEGNEVDVAGNCGNMSAAIGPYAYNAGLLPPRVYAQGNGSVTVRIRNTNTGKHITSTFDVAGGQAAVVGDYTIDGVGGKGAQIRLDFKHPYGSKTAKVLPTGHRIDRIVDHSVTCVDGANPCVFIRASHIGVDGAILPADLAALPDKLALLERIRRAAAVAMGIAATEDDVPRTIPKIGLISMSSTHTLLDGRTLQTAQSDLVVRFLSDTQPHRAIPLTAALTTALAARIPGTLVEQLLSPDPVTDGVITIGHASGTLQVDATMDRDNLTPINGTVYRTAKRLFEGTTFWVDDATSKPEEHVLRSGYGAHGTHSLGMAFVLESRGQSTAELWPEHPPNQEVHEEEPTQKIPEKQFTMRRGPEQQPIVDQVVESQELADKGRQWHQWAKRHAALKQSLRTSVQRKEAKEAKEKKAKAKAKAQRLDSLSSRRGKKVEREEHQTEMDMEMSPEVIEELLDRHRARELRWAKAKSK